MFVCHFIQFVFQQISVKLFNTMSCKFEHGHGMEIVRFWVIFLSQKVCLQFLQWVSANICKTMSCKESVDLDVALLAYIHISDI